MPWKQRGYQSYWYESVREGGKVRSRYVGGGMLGRLAAERVKSEREHRKADRRIKRARRNAEAVTERQKAELFDLSRQLAEWALHAAGFHRPTRGPWRRRRQPMSDTTNIEPATTPSSPPIKPLELQRRMEQAMLESIVSSATGNRKDEGAREAANVYRRDLLSFAGELAGPDPPPIIRALAFSAAVAYFDWIYAGFRGRKDNRRERDMERAERRFQRAVKTLHEVQRRLPNSFMAVQINVGTRASQAMTTSEPS